MPFIQHNFIERINPCVSVSHLSNEIKMSNSHNRDGSGCWFFLYVRKNDHTHIALLPRVESLTTNDNCLSAINVKRETIALPDKKNRLWMCSPLSDKCMGCWRVLLIVRASSRVRRYGRNRCLLTLYKEYLLYKHSKSLLVVNISPPGSLRSNFSYRPTFQKQPAFPYLAVNRSHSTLWYNKAGQRASRRRRVSKIRAHNGTVSRSDRPFCVAFMGAPPPVSDRLYGRGTNERPGSMR